MAGQRLGEGPVLDTILDKIAYFRRTRDDRTAEFLEYVAG